MSVVSNGQFWMYTFALLIFWIIVLTTAFNFDTNANNKIALPSGHAEDELKSTVNCKSLCKQCRCMGFYCGEECICECNNDHSDTECIRRIQDNAQKLNISYEILIQGPKANNFVRNALQFEQNEESKLAAYRNKRSTVTVYKPNKGKNNRHPKSPVDSPNWKNTPIKDVFNVTKKVKRASNRFDWFSDLRNNLLRPAPLSGHRRKAEEPTQKPKISKVPSLFDNSWIFDNNGIILTPKPLNNRKSSNILSSSSHENKLESSSIGTTRPKKVKKKFNDDFADSHANLKSDKMNAKNYFLPEQNKREESQENLIGSLYSRLFKNDFSRTDDSSSVLAESQTNQDESHDSFSSEQNKRVESQENLIGSFYSRLFKNDFRRTDDGSSFLPENKKNPDESHDYGLGDLSKIDDENDLFSEEKEEEKITKKLKTTQDENSAPKSAQVSSSLSQGDGKKILPPFRFRWFKPGKLFRKFRKVINV